MEKSLPFRQKEIQETHKKMNESVLPITEKAFQEIKDFYKKEAQDYQSILRESAQSGNMFRNKIDECQTNINDILNQKNKDQKITTKGQSYLQRKVEQIKSKVGHIDAVGSGIKQTVSKIKPATLVDLPIKEERVLKELFTTLFIVLYDGKQDQFDWEVFRKKALKHIKGEDFIFRMVNFNFKQMPKNYYDRLMMLKADPQFDNACLNKPAYSHIILDLADWIEYACAGYQFAEQKKVAEKEYDKIRKDLDKRAKSGLQMSEKFWRQVSDQVQGFQNGVRSIEAEINGIIIAMSRSIEQIDETLIKRKDIISEINSK